MKINSEATALFGAYMESLRLEQNILKQIFLKRISGYDWA